MSRKIFVIFLSIVLISTAFAGCATLNEESMGHKGTRVILNEVAHSCFYAPLYVAIEEGYFADEGIDLELVCGFGADKTMASLLSNEADIGLMGCESTIYTYLGGASDYVVNFALLTKRAGNFIVGKNENPEFTVKDLVGKTVLGGRPGGMPEMVFEYILRKNGINPDTDLTIDKSIDFGQTAAAFSGGQGDYTLEFEPYATLLEQKGDGKVLASLGELSGYVPYTSFSAKKEYIENNQEIIQGFVNALKRGVQFVKDNDAETVAEVISPQFSETDVETIAKIVERYNNQDTWNDTLTFDEDGFELLTNILLDSQVIDKPADYNSLVTGRFTD